MSLPGGPAVLGLTEVLNVVGGLGETDEVGLVGCGEGGGVGDRVPGVAGTGRLATDLLCEVTTVAEGGDANVGVVDVGDDKSTTTVEVDDESRDIGVLDSIGVVCDVSVLDIGLVADPENADGPEVVKVGFGSPDCESVAD